MSIFKACDVRGRYGQDLTPEIAERFGLAVGSALGGSSVVVGGDLRPSTPLLKDALNRGLLLTGCHVLDAGILPTPAFHFAKDRLGVEGGVMITGSHNPPGDNGFKLTLGPWPITEAELATIEERMTQGEFTVGKGSYDQVDVMPDYRSFIIGKFPRSEGQLRVVVDAGNGSYSRIAPEVLGSLGCEVVELFCEPDGRFPNRSPNPAVAANLGALRETVIRTSANLGVAYDGDGDRAVFADERGRVVESDCSIVLLARYLLAGKPGGEVIYDIKCSSIVPEGIRAAGGMPVIEKSGHAFIKMALLKRHALLGGEISGHFFFGELGGDDGLYATLMMLQIVAESGGSLAALVDGVPRYPITPDMRLPCAPEEAQAIVSELTSVFATEPGCEVSRLDGVRIAWSDGWALVRASVTEPLITLRFEAHTEARLAEIRAAVVARSPKLQPLLRSTPHVEPWVDASDR
jgi:phosphomannomutase/phosphoglucomutase